VNEEGADEDLAMPPLQEGLHSLASDLSEMPGAIPSNGPELDSLAARWTVERRSTETMTHQSPEPTVRVRAAIRLRSCPCGARMYLIDGPTESNPKLPRAYWCADCGRMEDEQRRVRVPKFVTGKLRIYKGAVA
jgi:hypothetical protein